MDIINFIIEEGLIMIPVLYIIGEIIKFTGVLNNKWIPLTLEVSIISEQTNGNSFNIANNKFGIHIKYSKPTDSELNKIKKYYKLFGYQVNDQSSYLDKVDSMSVCNYVKFSGSWTIPGADVSIIEMMKAQFENGVRLWHNKNTRNPMIQNVLTNKIGG